MSAHAARLPEPGRMLPAAAKTYWRTHVLLVAVPVLAVLAAALGPLWALAAAVVAAAGGWIGPAVLWRRWRYEVREDEVDLRHGLWTVRRTLVPIRRVQHVDTETGPLQGAFDLATVSLHTAAGRTRIPALARGEAEAVRRRVGELARTRDDV